MTIEIDLTEGFTYAQFATLAALGACAHQQDVERDPHSRRRRSHRAPLFWLHVSSPNIYTKSPPWMTNVDIQANTVSIILR